MRLLELSKLNEKFTPQIEGWYDSDDMLSWLNQNYSKEAANEWNEMVNLLATSLDEVQASESAMNTYKAGDVRIMNDFVEDLPFDITDLQYYKNKPFFKTVSTRTIDRE